jgi:hypothetical protein
MYLLFQLHNRDADTYAHAHTPTNTRIQLNLSTFQWMNRQILNIGEIITTVNGHISYVKASREMLPIPSIKFKNKFRK